jgi:hypothetical protein
MPYHYLMSINSNECHWETLVFRCRIPAQTLPNGGTLLGQQGQTAIGPPDINGCLFYRDDMRGFKARVSLDVQSDEGRWHVPATPSKRWQSRRIPC